MTKRTQQNSFFNDASRHRFCSGGDLRNQAAGRKARKLTTKNLHHAVFKIQRRALPKGLRSPRNFTTVNAVIRQYARRFLIRIDQLAIQSDHIHLTLRATRRSHFQFFFRVVAGQIAQRLMTDTPTEPSSLPRLWKHRPWTRVIARSQSAERIARAYVRLNAEEARGERAYRKERLRGLGSEELWQLYEQVDEGGGSSGASKNQ